MSYSFEIIVFLLLLANISLNLYVYKEIVLRINRSETPLQPAPEKIFVKTPEKPKEQSEEDRIIQGLNNLLVYDGNPSLKKE
jgi:hypothetical protein